MERNNIKTIIFSTFVASVMIHDVVEEVIEINQSDHFSDFSGHYVMKNSDSSDTAVLINVVPSIINNIDGID